MPADLPRLGEGVAADAPVAGAGGTSVERLDDSIVSVEAGEGCVGTGGFAVTRRGPHPARANTKAKLKRR
ncbi:MAG: hypothetical protein ACREIW_15300 [Chthoniobacterales bacterium]